MRKTGIDVVGVRPWGTHVCQFYETKDDLLDTLVPYFEAGLASNEHCVWVIANPLAETEARAALGEAVPALDRHFAERSIEIVLAREWYFEDDTFDPISTMKRWKEKLAAALGRGYDGLRGAGHLSWLSATQWKALCDYEKALDESVSNQPMIVLCTYPAGTTGAAEILAVARTHHVSLARRRARWEVFEPSTVNPAKEEIRRLNEDELRKSEERWRAVFENSAVGIVLQSGDRSGRFVAANAAYQRMLGYSEDELRALTFVDITYDEDREINRRLTAELLEGRRESFTLTKRNRRKDGSLMWVSIHVSLIPATGNDGTLFMSVVDDITERKHAEEALRKAEAELAHVTRVTTMGELASSIAHEVNQPLTAIVANTSACLNWLKADCPPLGSIREALVGVVDDGNRAGEVIARIRALVKKSAPAKERLDVNGVIHEVVALVRNEALSRRVSLRTELASELPAVLGDRVQLQQVMINLAINGMDAMASVTDRPRELLIQSQRESDQVLVTVQDSGTGIDPENVNRIFDAFFTTKSNGMGMGLSISRSIVEAHGGRLWAGSNVGPGATFQFSLPTATKGES